MISKLKKKNSLKSFNIIGPCPYEVFEKGICLTVMVTSALAGIPYSTGRWAKEEIWEVDFIYLLIFLFKHLWGELACHIQSHQDTRKLSLKLLGNFHVQGECGFDLECSSSYDNSMAGS